MAIVKRAQHRLRWLLKCSLLFKIEITKFNNAGTMGVTLAELVKASVGQADLKRSEVRASLGHYCLSCGMFLVKSRRQGTLAKLAISLSGWLGRYTKM